MAIKTLIVFGRDLPGEYQMRLGADFHASRAYEIHEVESAAEHDRRILVDGEEMSFRFVRACPDREAR